MKKTTSWISAFLFLAISAAPVAFGDDTAPSGTVDHAQHHSANMKGMIDAKSGKALTPEMRAKMAEMHQLMADCMKSDRPMSECKQEMMKNCPVMKETGQCPMMGEMGGMGQSNSAKHHNTKKTITNAEKH